MSSAPRTTGSDLDPAADGPAAGLTEQQVTFFRTFGFLRIPGLFGDQIDDISDAFDEVFASTPAGGEFGDLSPDDFTRNFAAHDRIDTFQHLNLGRRRAIIPGFVEKCDRLVGLIDHPRVQAAVTSILGPDHEYVGGDGNVFSCDTAWHCDVYGSTSGRPHMKVFFYLDPLDAGTGALRVIPGSNHHGSSFAGHLWTTLDDWESIPERLGVPWDQIPSYTVENQPGDVLLGDYRTFHATINSGEHRRLFTLNFRQSD